MALIKLCIFFIYAIIFFLLAAPLYFLESVLKLTTRSLIVKLLSFYARRCLKLFGVRLSVNDMSNYKLTDSNFLLVSNHLSYIDVLIVSSVFPAYFITSLDMKATPFLGQICKMAQCLFVNRKSRKNIEYEVGQISQKLSEGSHVALFPEATSTNGEKVLPFKRSIFQAAINTCTDALPLCINYKGINNSPVSLENRDLVCWYGKMDFFPHFYKMLQQKKIYASLTINAPLEVSDKTDIRALADQCHSLIDKNYSNIQARKSFENPQIQSEFHPSIVNNTHQDIQTQLQI